MKDVPKNLTAWVNFAGTVLVVAVLYWARVVLIPLAFATLLAFLLTPLVVRLQRWIGRVPAVLATVALTFGVLGLAGWGLANQMGNLTAELPGYRANIRQKIADVREAGKGGPVEKIQDILEVIEAELERPDGPQDRTERTVVVRAAPIGSSWLLSKWLGPFMGPLATAGLVIALVIFMLLERESMRARMIGLIGHGNLAVTTKAFEEAGKRVSRQLLLQTLVNALYGVAVGVGLYIIGVPYALLWASLTAVLRFVPYVGPIIGAIAPILVGLAALPGWARPFSVIGLILGIELFTNLVLETVLYAGAAGVSQVALLVAFTFWTWLWGPMGLLMATPLTVCFVVLGKHVRGLEFLSHFMKDAPALAPDINYYQRLLAHDPSEASDIVDRHIKAESLESVYDALLIPALSYAERDRLEDRMSIEEERAVLEATRELMSDAAVADRSARAARGERNDSTPDEERPPASTRLKVLAYPASEVSDELALLMLSQLLAHSPVELEILSTKVMTSELVGTIRASGCSSLCIADLPPSLASKTRYMIKKLRAALPELEIVVGRWAPPALVDDRPDLLIEVGAAHVGSTLLDTRDFLLQAARRKQPLVVAN